MIRKMAWGKAAGALSLLAQWVARYAVKEVIK